MIKLILPSLVESGQPGWRPLKYSLFPPLTLATLAAWIPPEIEVCLCDEHVEDLNLDDQPKLVIIQVYTSSARRAYQIADHYRSKNIHVALGGIHVTALPAEARAHADTLFMGPADDAFKAFISDWLAGIPKRTYLPGKRDLACVPMPRRDLYNASRYLVPSTLVVSRGCPHNCSFCYIGGMYKDGRSYYSYKVDQALSEIEALPDKNIYFLDDNLFADERFALALMEGMRGMGKVFQAAATLKALSNRELLRKAAQAGMKSIFTGFESIRSENLKLTGKSHNYVSYEEVIAGVHQQGILINGSFVFGLDDDDTSVFRSTTDWAVGQGITTATFHIATPFPGSAYFKEMKLANRLLHQEWDLYDTRHAVFRPKKMQPDDLEKGYWQAYNDFYSWHSIIDGALAHDELPLSFKHLLYSAAWKKIELPWRLVIKAGLLPFARRFLETGLGLKSRIQHASIQQNTSHHTLLEES